MKQLREVQAIACRLYKLQPCVEIHYQKYYGDYGNRIFTEKQVLQWLELEANLTAQTEIGEEPTPEAIAVGLGSI